MLINTVLLTRDGRNISNPIVQKSLKALSVCLKCHFPVWANEVCSCTV